jgi:hypothetical protein
MTQLIDRTDVHSAVLEFLWKSEKITYILQVLGIYDELLGGYNFQIYQVKLYKN